jgi:hypothetical protein
MNKEVSFLIFLFALLVCIKCCLDQRYYDAVLVMTYGLIQLFEFVIHLKPHSGWNSMATLCLCLTLSLQPLSIALASKYFLNVSNLSSNVNFGLISAYMVFFWMFLWSARRHLMTVQGKSCHLIWGPFARSSNIIRVLSILYIVTSVIVFINAKDYLVLGLFLGTLCMAYLYNYLIHGGTESINGSLWCFMAIVLIVSFGIFI